MLSGLHRTADAKMFGGFGDRVFFSLHAIVLHHNSSRVDRFLWAETISLESNFW
jgi:hypothetical protein